MSDRTVLLEARCISKRFRLYRSPADRLREWLTLGRWSRHKDFWALRDVSLTLRRGDCLGVIGANGSGKTTLLKILSGALSPTAGSVSANGRVFALIELSTGFNRDLTGRQNIQFAGQMLGLDRAYIDRRSNQIIEFADLGEFLDQPVGLYSAGMRSRLGFALFAFLEPDVFMIDEVLAVGDAAFKRKCFDLIEQRARSESGAAVFVSHSLAAVMHLCSRTLWIDRGEARMIGPSRTVVEAFLEETRGRAGDKGAGSFDPGLGDDETAGAPAAAPSGGLITGEPPGPDASLAGAWLERPAGPRLETARAHVPFVICFAVRFGRATPQPLFELVMRDTGGEVIGICDSGARGISAGHYRPGQTQVVRCRTARGLDAGTYALDIRCWSGQDREALLLDRPGACTFTVDSAGRTGAAGLFLPPALPPPQEEEEESDEATKRPGD